jgi:hypothetical protein
LRAGVSLNQSFVDALIVTAINDLMVHYLFPYCYSGIYVSSNCIECVQLKGFITDMKIKNLLISVSIAVVLSGCTSVVTKENVSTFETWHLCALMYRPLTVTPDWTASESDKADMQSELLSRGISTQDQCSTAELSKSMCDGYGFKSGSNEYAGCMQNADISLRARAQTAFAKKKDEDAQAAANWQAFADGIEKGKANNESSRPVQTHCTRYRDTVNCTTR